MISVFLSPIVLFSVSLLFLSRQGEREEERPLFISLLESFFLSIWVSIDLGFYRSGFLPIWVSIYLEFKFALHNFERLAPPCPQFTVAERLCRII